LLELILVLIIICTALAIAAPRLSGFLTGSRGRDVAMQINALAHWASAQAVTQGRTFRLNVENGTRYWVTVEDPNWVMSRNTGEAQQQNDTPMITPDGDFGQVFQTPDGTQVVVERTDGGPSSYITFYPDGREEVARFRVVQGDQDVAVVATNSPTEPYRQLRPGEAP
jgi:Tfp pilus assembly protein FimT